MEWLKRLVLVLFSLAIGLVAAEFLLRLQQRLGPLVDLEFNNISNLPSETLNHAHAAREDWRLDDASKYGELTGYRYTSYYDALGVRVDPVCNRADPQATRILFLGDSFMEGYDLQNTIPRHVCEALRQAEGMPRSIRVLNAGTSSYSPSIYIVQAKALLPKLLPDLVVVDIDETDLADDYLRYRSLTTLDAAGHVAAVHSTPANRDFTNGFLHIKEANYRLYLARFLLRLQHTRLRAQTRADRVAMAAIDALQYARDTRPGAAQRYSDEIAFFESRLDELALTLIALAGGPERILFTYHPHLQQLRAESGGRVWNSFVSDALNRVAARHGVRFYNATEDLRQQFGVGPQLYYWPNDMHFNFEGIAAYGRLLAPQIAALLKRPTG